MVNAFPIGSRSSPCDLSKCERAEDPGFRGKRSGTGRGREVATTTIQAPSSPTATRSSSCAAHRTHRSTSSRCPCAIRRTCSRWSRRQRTKAGPGSPPTAKWLAYVANESSERHVLASVSGAGSAMDCLHARRNTARMESKRQGDLLSQRRQDDGRLTSPRRPRSSCPRRDSSSSSGTPTAGHHDAQLRRDAGRAALHHGEGRGHRWPAST